MKDEYKRFEIMILQPFQILFIGCIILFLLKAMWLWAGGFLLAVFYLGIIGSKLHPLQSAADLSRGPLNTPLGQAESAILLLETKKLLVGHACTRTGILLGISIGALLWKFLGLHWFIGIPIIWILMILLGAILKIIFKTLPIQY
jgi:hypothetical protein